MIKEPDLIYTKENHIAYLTMNRPERRNAMSPEMMVTLTDAFNDIRKDADIHVAVITGAGDAGFCSGGDTKLLMPLVNRQRLPDNEWEERLMAEEQYYAQSSLLNAEPIYKPIIAAVNGPAVGGGCELIQGTDIRISSTTATYGLREVPNGIIPAGGSLVRLQRQIPYCRAAELIFLGELISAETALSYGLINEVVEPDQVMPRAVEVAQRIASLSPMAMQKAKEALRLTQGLPVDEATQVEQRCWEELMEQLRVQQ
jgi:enoyl-CoA hydratase